MNTRMISLLINIFPLLIIINGQSLNCSSAQAPLTIHQCLGCNFLWEISLNKCISKCPEASQFYNQKTMACQNCPEKCETCINGNQCSKCIGNLQYNYEYNKCICAIEGCSVCDFKGLSCKQCSNGFQQDFNLKCIKVQPTIDINPIQGFSLQTQFLFSVKNISKKAGISYKCIILGTNISTENTILISHGSCSFNTYLPTLNTVDIFIFEYSTEPNSGEVTQVNQYNSSVKVNIVSPFSQINHLWSHIKEQIRLQDNVQLQIFALSEYSFMIKNVCQSQSFCSKSFNLCYSPGNICVCGPQSDDGLRDCSSSKEDEIQLNQYLNNAYSLCKSSTKGQFNSTCPDPQLNQIYENNQKYIQFLIDQSHQFIDDFDFILTLRNALTSLDNSMILSSIYSEIVKRYVGKYNKIFSKADSYNNLLVIYNTQITQLIDYSIFQSGQIPIQFFEQQTSNFVQFTENENLQKYFQQILFSNFLQRVINKYTQKYNLEFQYIKLMWPNTIQLAYSFTQKDEFFQKQMVCLQSNQTVDQSTQQELEICDSMMYDESSNSMRCKCSGDTFIFLDDSQYLYLSKEDYHSIIFKGSLENRQKMREDSANNDSKILMISLSVLAGIILIVFLIVVCVSRKSKRVYTEKIMKDIFSPYPTFKFLKGKNQIDTREGTMKKENNNDIEIQSPCSPQEQLQVYIQTSQKLQRASKLAKINKDITISLQQLKKKDQHQKQISKRELFINEKEQSKSCKNSPKNILKLNIDDQKIDKSVIFSRKREQIKDIIPIKKSKTLKNDLNQQIIGEQDQSQSSNQKWPELINISFSKSQISQQINELQLKTKNIELQTQDSKQMQILTESLCEMNQSLSLKTKSNYLQIIFNIYSKINQYKKDFSIETRQEKIMKKNIKMKNHIESPEMIILQQSNRSISNKETCKENDQMKISGLSQQM